MTMVADYQELLVRREALADRIVSIIGTLGVAIREEAELREDLRRVLRAAGVKAEPFNTALSVEAVVGEELCRAGVPSARCGVSVRLTDLVERQNRNARELLATTGRAA
jgi:hypothetical protein